MMLIIIEGDPYWASSTMPSILHVLIHLILTTILGVKQFFPHLASEDTEAHGS